MKFIPLDVETEDLNLLKNDFKSAHQIGIVSLGQNFLFIRKTFSVLYIPYSDLKQAYRRVYLVPAKMCCASGNLEVENLVIHNAEKEVAVASLPGKKAAELLIKELKEKSPATDFNCPPRPVVKTPGKSEKSKQAHKAKTAAQKE